MTIGDLYEMARVIVNTLERDNQLAAQGQWDPLRAHLLRLQLAAIAGGVLDFVGDNETGIRLEDANLKHPARDLEAVILACKGVL